MILVPAGNLSISLQTRACLNILAVPFINEEPQPSIVEKGKCEKEKRLDDVVAGRPGTKHAKLVLQSYRNSPVKRLAEYESTKE